MAIDVEHLLLYNDIALYHPAHHGISGAFLVIQREASLDAEPVWLEFI